MIDVAACLSPMLARLFGGIDADLFLSQYWQRRHLIGHLSGGRRLDVDALRRMIRFSDLRYPSARMYRHGLLVPQSEFSRPYRYGGEVFSDVVDGAAVDRLIAEGCTLVVQSIEQHDDDVAELCHDLEAELLCAVQANAFYTPPSSSGLAAHYDHTDVIVIQLSGSKRWRVWADYEPLPTGKMPFDQGRATRHAATHHPDGTFVLAPGDVLYLPRGMLHETAAEDLESLHLSLVVHAVRWATALETMVREAVDALSGDEKLRRSVLRPGSVVARHGIDTNIARVRETVAQLIDNIRPDDLERLAMTERAARAMPIAARRIRGVIASRALDPDSVIVATQNLMLDDLPNAGQVALYLAGKTLSFPRPMAGALKALGIRGARSRIRHLPGILSLDAKLAIARTLILHGLAEIADESVTPSQAGQGCAFG